MASRLPNALHIIFPDAAHDLLRSRTSAVLAVEAAAVRGGLEEAERVARDVTADGPWHPQRLISSAVVAYLTFVSASRRTAVRRGAAAFALAVLGALAWWVSRGRLAR